MAATEIEGISVQVSPVNLLLFCLKTGESTCGQLRERGSFFLNIRVKELRYRCAKRPSAHTME
jgi:hypothetical protein